MTKSINFSANRPQITDHSYSSSLSVLYITHYNSLGGGANLSLLSMMLDMHKRHKVIPSVLIPGEGEFSEKCRENGIETFCTKFYNWQNINKFTHGIKATAKHILNRTYYFRKILTLLKGHQFDIIHTNSSVTELGSLIAEKFSIPHIWHIREYGSEDYNLCYLLPSYIVKSYYARAEKVIAISKSIRECYVNEWNLCPSQNICVVYNGIKIPSGYEKRYPPKGQRINFCIIGGVWPGKNQIMAVNACAKLKVKTDNFMLHIIGTDTDYYAQNLKNLAASLGLEDNVKFWGWRGDAVEIMRTMDVGLMLSKREAFGRVTIEYMMNYMPVIGVDTGATPEIITDGETGFLCPLDNADRLAELMHKFIMNPELLTTMGHLAREHAVKNFSLERNTDEIYSLYQEIIRQKNYSQK